MKITRRNRVLIETTNMIHGCLEQGGICGLVESYPLDEVMQAVGMTREEIGDADQNDPWRGTTLADVIRLTCNEGRVVRKGHVIQ